MFATPAPHVLPTDIQLLFFQILIIGECKAMTMHRFFCNYLEADARYSAGRPKKEFVDNIHVDANCFKDLGSPVT